MQYQIQSDKAFIRIDKGEDLTSNILIVMEREGWHSATFSGIGALTNFDLGFYQIKTKTYLRQHFDDIYELLSLQGNLALRENRPFLHLHAVLSNQNFHCIGGHLFSATVGVTCEINALKLNINMHRQMDDTLKLSLLQFQ